MIVDSSIVCSTTTLMYTYKPFPIIPYFYRQCICLRSDTCDKLMHVAYFYLELWKFILQEHASELFMHKHVIWVYSLITKAKFGIQLHCKHYFNCEYWQLRKTCQNINDITYGYTPWTSCKGISYTKLWLTAVTFVLKSVHRVRVVWRYNIFLRS